MRLWDYQSGKEVGMVPVVIKKCAEDEEVGEDTKLSADEKEEERMDDNGEEECDDENFDDDFTDDEESFDEHMIAVPLSVALGPNAESVVVVRDGFASIDIHPIPPPPSKSSTTSLMLSHLVSLHEKQTLECPSQPLAVRCLSDGSVLVLASSGPEYLLHYQLNDSREEDARKFKNVSQTSPFTTALQGAVKDQTIVMPTTTLDRMDDGEFTLQKNKVSDPGDDTKKQREGGGLEDVSKKGGLHWNDAGRKEMAKEAESRRRKRRREEKWGKKEKSDESEK